METGPGGPPGYPVSLSAEDRGRPQPFTVTVRGIEYPGEVTIANAWHTALGEPLTGGSMFRIVLLEGPYPPSSGDLLDPRIGVASWGEAAGHPATGDDFSGSYATVRSELSVVRETRARYLAGSDPGLRRLAASLAEQERQMQAQLRSKASSHWISGAWTESGDGDGGSSWPGGVGPGLGMTPWLESRAFMLLDHSGCLPAETAEGPLDGRALEAMWSDIASGRAEQVMARLALRFPRVSVRLAAAGYGHTVTDRIDALLQSRHGEATNPELRRLLVHELAIPPEIAGTCIAAHVALRDSEIVLVSPGGLRAAGNDLPDPPRLIRDQLAGTRYLDDLLARTGSLRSSVQGDWDSALPYVRLVMPDAQMLSLGGGSDQDATAFRFAVETLEGRLTLVVSMQERLAEKVYASDTRRSLSAARALAVLAIDSWQEYFSRARSEFGSIEALRDALQTLQRFGRAAEHAIEVERAAAYLDSASFGRVDQALSAEADALRSRLVLEDLLRSPDVWPALHAEFERWRRRYRRAYVEHHSEQQVRARAARELVEARTTDLQAVMSLSAIPELDPAVDQSLPDRWLELSAAVAECPLLEHQLALTEGPFCPSCGSRMGAPDNHEDLRAVASEIESALAAQNRLLSDAAVRDILANRRRAEVEKLLNANAASDLSRLTSALGDDVLAFLRQFMRGTHGPEGPRQS